MQPESYSWCMANSEQFPEATAKPHFLPDKRTCVLPVRLKPGRVYALWLNTDANTNFRDEQGSPSVPYLLVFQTSSESRQQ